MYHALDSGCASSYPELTVQLDGLPADYDLGVFLRCNDGSTPTYSCAEGSSCSWSGYNGCCSALGGTATDRIRTTMDCSGVTNDEVYVYMHVYAADDTWASCTAYRLIYLTR